MCVYTFQGRETCRVVPPCWGLEEPGAHALCQLKSELERPCACSVHRGFKGSPPASWYEVGNCGLGHKKEFALSGLSNWFLGGQFGVFFEFQAKPLSVREIIAITVTLTWQSGTELSGPHVESLPTVLKYEKWEPFGPQSSLWGLLLDPG